MLKQNSVTISEASIFRNALFNQNATVSQFKKFPNRNPIYGDLHQM